MTMPSCADDVLHRIATTRKALGDRVTILGHHYQADDIMRFADHTGPFMIHCHMLDHEDHGMMARFDVVR